jgi:hypothetical protein
MNKVETKLFDPNDKIDAAIETILKASGSSMKYYDMYKPLEDMRNAMRKIMSDSYIAGSNACYEVLVDED